MLNLSILSSRERINKDTCLKGRVVLNYRPAFTYHAKIKKVEES